MRHRRPGFVRIGFCELDADYEVIDALKVELSRLDDDAAVDGYRIAFDYAIFGQRLLSSLYPPNTILLRKGRFSVEDKGHTETWAVQGRVKDLRARITHDDGNRQSNG